MVANLRFEPVKVWRGRLTAIVAPALFLVNAPAQLINFVKTNVTSYHQLQTENDLLRRTQFIMNAQLQKYLAMQQENQHLHALLDSKPPAGGRMMVAQVLAVAHDPNAQVMVLDKGTQQNVTIGQPVLDANGIMGQVIEANLLTSRVLAVTDPRSSVPVQVARTGERGMAVGQGASGYLKLMHIPQSSQVLVGDILVSSGLGQRYPAGYPVGVVDAVVRNPGDPFLDITLRPSSAVNRTQLVLLLWRKGEGGAFPELPQAPFLLPSQQPGSATIVPIPELVKKEEESEPSVEEPKPEDTTTDAPNVSEEQEQDEDQDLDQEEEVPAEPTAPAPRRWNNPDRQHPPALEQPQHPLPSQQRKGWRYR